MEAAIWLVASLAAPAVGRALDRRLPSRLMAWRAELAFWADVGYGVLPLYLPWVTGSVLGIDSGLAGISAGRWLTGAAVSGAAIAALAIVVRVRSARCVLQTWFIPAPNWLFVLDEPRWAFYRGAAAAFVGSSAVAQVGGLLLGAGEWLVRRGRPTRATSPAVWSGLVRLGVSAVLFAVTRNLWLVALTQAAAQALVLRSWTETATAD